MSQERMDQGDIIEFWLCIMSGSCFAAATHNFWAGACFGIVVLLVWAQSEDWRTAYRNKNG